MFISLTCSNLDVYGSSGRVSKLHFFFLLEEEVEVDFDVFAFAFVLVTIEIIDIYI